MSLKIREGTRRLALPVTQTQTMLTRRSARAFTLIELLVVIAIIAILAVLSFVGLARVKDSANATKCGNNVRQFTRACLQYAGDNDGRLPPSSILSTSVLKAALSPYVPDKSELWYCPADDKKLSGPQSPNPDWAGSTYHYDIEYLSPHGTLLSPTANPNCPLSTIRVIREAWCSHNNKTKITIGMLDGSVALWPIQPWLYDGPTRNIGSRRID